MSQNDYHEVCRSSASVIPGIVIFVALLLCCLALPAYGEDNIVADPEKVDPSLPNVLLIGDSISIGYTDPVRKELEGKANVYRIPANSEHSRKVLANIDTWLAGRTYAVIHLNTGLHEVKLRGGKPQLTVEEYEKNLSELFTRLKATKAAVIWATTTPIPEGTGKRVAGAEIPYNAKALELATAAGLPIDDLNAVIKDEVAKYQLPHDVHFTAAGYALLAKSVSASIIKALATAKP